MSAKAESFIVVTVGDAGGYGFDEHTLPMLLVLVDAFRPDYRSFTHTGVTAQFRTSRRKLIAVQKLVKAAEALRSNDARFAELKIGVAEGELIGEFDWLGRVKTTGMGLMGDANVEAVRSEKAGDYEAKLTAIEQSLYERTA